MLLTLGKLRLFCCFWLPKAESGLWKRVYKYFIELEPFECHIRVQRVHKYLTRNMNLFFFLVMRVCVILSKSMAWITVRTMKCQIFFQYRTFLPSCKFFHWCKKFSLVEISTVFSKCMVFFLRGAFRGTIGHFWGGHPNKEITCKLELPPGCPSKKNTPYDFKITTKIIFTFLIWDEEEEK